MSELQDHSPINVRDRLMYDPVIKGYDQSFFKTTAGTPSTSGGNLRFNAAAASSYSQYVYADLVIEANVATTPSTGEAKIWGFQNEADQTMGAAYFEITGATFRAVTYSDDRTAQTTSITWNSRSETWEAVMVSYRILWEKGSVKFYVTTGNDFGDPFATHTTSTPTVPLAIRLDNENDSDNFDVDWILVKRIGKLIT